MLMVRLLLEKACKGTTFFSFHQKIFLFSEKTLCFFEQMLLYFKKNYYLCPLNYILVIFVEPQKF